MNSSTLERESLRYYLHDSSDALRFQLIGSLTMESAEDLELTWNTASTLIGDRPVLIDVSGVTAIDWSGQEVLHSWNARGARLVVATREAQSRLQRMTGLPVAILRRDPPGPAWLRTIERWIRALV
jgi:anti-anti-sigma regulatory factor